MIIFGIFLCIFLVAAMVIPIYAVFHKPTIKLDDGNHGVLYSLFWTFTIIAILFAVLFMLDRFVWN